jgi:hypothetical protein
MSGAVDDLTMVMVMTMTRNELFSLHEIACMRECSLRDPSRARPPLSSGMVLN